MGDKIPVGKITHYFSKISVAVIELSGTLKVGDTISIEGATSNVQQKVDSMQIEYKPVESAGKGQSVGLKVAGTVREADDVYIEK